MRNLTRSITIAVALCTAPPLLAAGAQDFYVSLLNRGVSAFGAGQYADATHLLRLAAFGLVDTIEPYETAQAYLTVAYVRIGDQEHARDAARRIVLAERIEKKFGTIALPPAVRTAFNDAATRLLGPGEVATLRGEDISAQPAPVNKPAVAQPATTATTQTKQPAVTAPVATAAKPVVEAPAPQAQTPKSQTPATPPTTPRQTTEAAQAPKVVETRTVPFPDTPAPKPAQAAPITAQQPPKAAPTKATPPPAAPATRTYTVTQLAMQLNAADRALSAASLPEARRIFRELLQSPSLDHATLLRVAEGLYRSRDFPAALSAFGRAGELRRGEEPYRYYIAVALYETGQYERAKQALSAVLPFIEVTPDVARYRTKIEGSLD